MTELFMENRRYPLSSGMALHSLRLFRFSVGRSSFVQKRGLIAWTPSLLYLMAIT